MSLPAAPFETIVALSSGPPPAGIAVLRVSGPAVRPLLDAMAGGVPEPRRAVLRTLRDLAGEVVDRGLVLFFPGRASVTGEDLAELHLHGGRAVIAAALGALAAFPGVRLAEAGEFTRRAFVNGRIDLTEAEGLADLLGAETDAQRRRALAQAGGAHRTLYEGWARRLLQARALLEADFDFSDEDDVSDEVALSVWSNIGALGAEIRAHLSGAERGEILRDGFRVAIVGAPNAGKSSLLNALARREAAIVSPVAGTTRDLVEVTLDLGGVPVRLVDTAGLRETADPVETIGVERALAAAGEADLVLLLLPSDEAQDDMTHVKRVSSERSLIVRSKSDLAEPQDGMSVSVYSGDGLAELIETLAQEAKNAAGDVTELVPTRERHRLRLASVLAILDEADLTSLPPEIAAETLRRAGDELGHLTGRTGVEDILDLVFSQFCIGK